MRFWIRPPHLDMTRELWPFTARGRGLRWTPPPPHTHPSLLRDDPSLWEADISSAQHPEKNKPQVSFIWKNPPVTFRLSGAAADDLFVIVAAGRLPSTEVECRSIWCVRVKWDPSRIWIMAPADCVQKSALIIQLCTFIIHEAKSEKSDRTRSQVLL